MPQGTEKAYYHCDPVSVCGITILSSFSCFVITELPATIIGPWLLPHVCEFLVQ